MSTHRKKNNEHSHSDGPLSAPLLLLNITLFSLILGLVFLISSIKQQHNMSALQKSEEIVDRSTFTGLKLEGLSAIVWDTTTDKVIFSKDADKPRPLASLTKIMTAVTAQALIPQNAIITVGADDLAEEGDNGLLADEKWKFKNLLDFSLVVSSNDGARAIASASSVSSRQNFIKEMNKNAKKLGLSTLRFTNETGLDTNLGYGGIGSARDVAKLLEYGLEKYPTMFEATQKKLLAITSTSMVHTAVNTDTALSNIPNVIASKTGFTDAAGGNLAVAFDADINRPIVIVVLGSSPEGRFRDVEKLASSTLAFIRANE